MKKFFAVLMLAALLMTGCGNQAQHAVNEVKQEAVSEVKETADKVVQKVDRFAGNTPTANADAKFSLGGISPGMTLDEVKRILGEPTSMHDSDNYAFANGLMVDLDDFGNVEDIKTYQSGAKTGAGIAVGMTEQNLTAAYGAPATTEHDDGLLEYKYYSGDGRIKIEFKLGNGTVTEIKCSLND